MRQKTEDELEALVLEKKRELLNLRFRKAAGEDGDITRFRKARRDVARAQTLLAERRRAAVATATSESS